MSDKYRQGAVCSRCSTCRSE